MASAESGRGTKRSIDDVQSDEDALERYGKLLWDYMIYHRTVIGLVAFISSSKAGYKNGFFVIGSDPDRTRWWRSSEPIWANYKDIWLATRLHPGETVETIDSRPTEKELSNRMAIFVSKALDKQKKYGSYRLSRSKTNHRSPTNSGAIIVSGPTHKSNHAGKSQASLPTASEHGGFDFFDGLAHAARHNFIQETHRLEAHIKYISAMLEDTRAALSDEKQSHRQDAEDTRKEIMKLTGEAEKKIRDLSAMLDEERKSSKDHLETADAKNKNLLTQLEELKRAHQKNIKVAENEIQQLRAAIDANKNAAYSELKKEKDARRKAAKVSSAAVQKLQAKQRKEQQDHDEEKKSLLKASEEASTKIQSLEAKVQDVSSKVEKERQKRHEAINNALEEAQRRMAKHHNEVMKGIATRHNEDKRSLQKKANDSESELLRLKDDYQKQSQELEKEQSDRRQEEADHKLEMECLVSENKKLKQEKEAHAQLRDEIVKLEETNRALQTTVNRFIAVANDVRP